MVEDLDFLFWGVQIQGLASCVVVFGSAPDSCKLGWMLLVVARKARAPFQPSTLIRVAKRS